MITHSQLSLIEQQQQQKKTKGKTNRALFLPGFDILKFQSKFVKIVSRFFLLYFTCRGRTLLKFLHWKRFTELIYTNLYVVIVSTERTNCNTRIIAFPKWKELKDQHLEYPPHLTRGNKGLKQLKRLHAQSHTVSLQQGLRPESPSPKEGLLIATILPWITVFGQVNLPEVSVLR